MSQGEPDGPAPVVGRIDMNAGNEAPASSPLTLIVLGGLSLLIMIGALLVILSNVFRVAA